MRIPRNAGISRRIVLAGGAVGAGLSAAGCATSLARTDAVGPQVDAAALHARWGAEGVVADEQGARRLGLAVRYRTDVDRIRPFLPPPLEVDPSAEVQINYFIILNRIGRSSVISPGPLYGECDMMVSCLYRGHRAMTSLPWILDQDYGRYAGREGVTLRKKEGLVFLDVRDGVMHARAERRGKTMMKITAPLTDKPSHPYFWFREVGWGEMRFDYRLNVDWRQSVFDDGPVELWQHFGADDGYPTGMPPEDAWPRLPRALDPKTISLDLGDPSPLDPYAELPVREILGGSASLGPALFPAMAVPRGPEGKAGRRQRNEPDERVNFGPVDPKPLESLAFVHKAWDPPIFQGRTRPPAAWPKKPGAIALSPDVMAAYRAREAIEIGPADMAVLTLDIDPVLHARTVPAAFDAGPDAQLRVMAASVDVSDVSTTPFNEVWLLSACRINGAKAWLALSHIVSLGGDVLNGREIWGYPTKLGEIAVDRGANRMSVLGRRLHRDFMSLDISRAGSSAATRSSETMTVIGAQVQPKGRTPRHKWVSNPWVLDLDGVRAIEAKSAVLSLPTVPAPDLIGLSDPWCEFAGATVRTAVVGRGLIRRLPATLLGPVKEDSRAFLIDRGDGYRPPPNMSKTTFMVRA